MNQSHPSTEICPWCGQPYPWDLDHPYDDLEVHAKDCPQIAEWERCKE